MLDIKNKGITMILYRKETEEETKKFFDLKQNTLSSNQDTIFECKYNRNQKRTHFSGFKLSINQGEIKGTVEIINVENKIIKAKFNGKLLSISSTSNNKLEETILNEIMKKHRTSSNNSPLISFTNSKEYCIICI